jgi:cytochrome b involved in lipid metabolism
MKFLTTISLFIFWAVVVALLVVGLLIYQDGQNPTATSNPIGTSTPSTTGNVGGKLSSLISGTILDLVLVSKHNSPSDCWSVVNGKVYNLTPAISSHPGGPNEVIKFCGQDATVAFNTKDGRGKPHSASANAMLDPYFIGTLGQRISGPEPKTVVIPVVQNKPVVVPASPTSVSLPAQTSIPIVSQNTVLNISEIAKHNLRNDCWLLIDNKIYNVTSYISSHPGGVGNITNYCGREASSAFNGLPHSTSAHSLLAQYYVGDLNQVSSNGQIQQNVQSTQSVTPPAGRGDDDEKEDDD